VGHLSQRMHMPGNLWRQVWRVPSLSLSLRAVRAVRACGACVRAVRACVRAF
jgi:hypothetical protein